MIIHSSDYNMELDVYIESERVAFEYQGEQHYRPIYGLGTNFEEQQIIDQEKRRACKQVPCSLIYVYILHSPSLSISQLQVHMDTTSTSVVTTLPNLIIHLQPAA